MLFGCFSMNLVCFFAGQDVARHYAPNTLSAADKVLLQRAPQRGQSIDWQTSRALKMLVAPQQIIALSHSHGAAALLAGPPGLRAGVDMEKMKTRNFSALASWTMNADEQRLLVRHDFQAALFYALWCAKEALIKAENLSFPADMPHIGWRETGRLYGLYHDVWQQMCVQVGDFMLASVWQDAAVGVQWQGVGAWQRQTFEIIELGVVNNK